MKKRILCVLLVLSLLIMCSCAQQNYGLSAKNPQSITVWHYYNGSLATQFESLVQEFNSTIGKSTGIVVYTEAKSNIDDLLSELTSSAQNNVGSSPLPNIFHCYPDTAMEILEQTELVSLDTYISEKEKESFVDAYIEEGSLGPNKTWYLYPIAKSTEVMMLNRTMWENFSSDTGVTTNALTTWEGVVDVAAQYYDWSGGDAFFGLDSFANYMEIGAAQLGKDIFLYDNEQIEIQADYDTFRKLWNCYYIPYIKGHYLKVGRFRSDDIKIGKIIAEVCSTSSASYFPTEVTTNDQLTYPIDYLVLPVPIFENATPYLIQQGADMAILKSTPKEEYASILFLQWFTQNEQNLRFTLQSGYLPVKEEALNRTVIDAFYEEHETSSIIKDTIYTALSQMEHGIIYATGDSIPYTARLLLETSMPNIAAARREEIQSTQNETNANILLYKYSDYFYFDQWYQSLFAELLTCTHTK